LNPKKILILLPVCRNRRENGMGSGFIYAKNIFGLPNQNSLFDPMDMESNKTSIISIDTAT